MSTAILKRVTMSDTIWVALITAVAAVIGTFGSIYIFRKTTQQTAKAQHQTDVVQADKTGIEGLRELAEQNRKDRAEWRKERAEMIAERKQDRERLDRLEAEVVMLRADREQDRARIKKLETERKWRVNYIHVLIDFIKGLGHTPPPPEDPVVLSAED